MSVLKNPFFIIPCMLFWINQLLERAFNLYIPFIHAYFDDLLAIPVVLGITLQIYRWIHPLKGDFLFSKVQIGIGVAYFSILFEVLLPIWSILYTSDFWDVLCYMLGAIFYYRYINVKDTKLSYA